MTGKQKISLVRVYSGEPMLPGAVHIANDAETGAPIMMDEERVQTLNVVSESVARRPAEVTHG